MITPAQAVVDHTLLIALARIHENFLNLLHASDSDTLTGLYNRRKFDHQLFARVAQPAGDSATCRILPCWTSIISSKSTTTTATSSAMKSC
jgi:predicted signal transduction protein with EAL and GGDEF domain